MLSIKKWKKIGSYDKVQEMLKKEFVMGSQRYFSRGLLCLGYVLVSQVAVACSPKPLPNVQEVPNNVQAIDDAIRQLEKRKQGLEGMKYMQDEEAMQHEFQGWMDYQSDLGAEANIDKKIAQVEEEINELKAKRAKLVK
jgi:uncharacterized small protein (DUF1192 family)